MGKISLNNTNTCATTGVHMHARTQARMIFNIFERRSYLKRYNFKGI